MAGRGGYSVVIEAVDNASKKIDAVNKRIEKMRAPIDRVQKSLTKFSDLTGITAIGRGIRGLGDRAIHAFEAIGRIVAPLGAITSAASLAGMLRLTSLWADFGTSLGFAAQRIGIASDRLQVLQGAARLAGSSGEAMTNGMRTLGDTLVNAVGGRAPEAVIMMNTLGISFRNADGSARKAADVLPELADKLAKIQSPTLRARAATALLGGAAEDLLPFLARGAAGLEEYRQKALKYGVINEKGVAAARKMQEAQIGLKMAVEGLGNSISEQLEPVLAPLMTQMADWIAANREWIAIDIGEKVQEFSDYLKTIDWKGIGTGIEHFVTGANDAVQAIGGWKSALEILLALWLTKVVVGFVVGGARILATFAAIKAASAAAGGASSAAGAAAAEGAGGAGLFGLGLGALGALGTTLLLGGDTPSGPEFNKAPSGPGFFGQGGTLEKGIRRLFGGGPAPSSSAADIKMDPTRRGFLDTLAGPESKGAYDVKNGGSRFTDFSRFPEGIGPGGTSTAAGRYQFISGTWRSEQQKLGLPDFSPASQDKAAWDLASTAYHERTNRDLDTDLKSGGHQSDIATALRSIWPSLPDGSQSRQSQDTFDKALSLNLARESAAPVSIAGGTGSPTAGQDVNLKGGASLKVTIDGTTDRGAQVATNTFGNIFSGAPQVVFAMPMGGR